MLATKENNMPNYNVETGTPYGVISLNSLQDWFNDEIYEWECPGDDEYYQELEEERKAKAIEMVEEADEEQLASWDYTPEDGYSLDDWKGEIISDIEEDIDEACNLLYSTGKYDSFEDEGPEFGVNARYGEIDGVSMMLAELGGALNIWVLKSPHTGLYSQCSPCIPGAGNLVSPNENGILCYDVPKEWRYDYEEES
jgi:hypothetical protein